jgi:hypothetical protein
MAIAHHSSDICSGLHLLSDLSQSCSTMSPNRHRIPFPLSAFRTPHSALAASHHAKGPERESSKPSVARRWLLLYYRHDESFAVPWRSPPSRLLPFRSVPTHQPTVVWHAPLPRFPPLALSMPSVSSWAPPLSIWASPLRVSPSLPRCFAAPVSSYPPAPAPASFPLPTVSPPHLPYFCPLVPVRPRLSPASRAPPPFFCFSRFSHAFRLPLALHLVPALAPRPSPFAPRPGSESGWALPLPLSRPPKLRLPKTGRLSRQESLDISIQAAGDCPGQALEPARKGVLASSRPRRPRHPEYSNTRILEYSKTRRLEYSNTRILEYSNRRTLTAATRRRLVRFPAY